MKKTKFKNITDNDLSVIGYGIVKAGQIVELPEGFYNANFKKVEIATKEVKEVKNKQLTDTKDK